MAAGSFWLWSIDRTYADAAFARGRALWTIDPAVFDRWGRRGLQLAEANMDALAKLCAAEGVRLTIVVYPWREQIRLRNPDNLQVRAWKAFAASHQAGFIDLFPAFIDGSPPDEVIEKNFIAGDSHWNAAGNRTVAEALRSSLGW